MLKLWLIMVFFTLHYIRYFSESLRIVGGHKTSITSVPSMASLQYNSKHICGANILNEKTVLTAGHCVNDFPAKSLSIRAGSDYHAHGGIVRSVAGKKLHPSYNDAQLKFDVALLYLGVGLVFSPAIQPIALPAADDILPAKMEGQISGWGTVVEDGKISKKLQSTTVKVFSGENCTRTYGNRINEAMFCAGLPSGVKDACQGDSGGPFIVSGKLVGIVSWGTGCGTKSFPGVYTRIAKINNWIINNLRQ